MRLTLPTTPNFVDLWPSAGHKSTKDGGSQRFLVLFLAGAAFFLAVVFFAVAPFLAVAAFLGAGGQTPAASFGAVAGAMTESLKPFRGVMRAFFDALILIASPVAGLRPMRAGRSTLLNL